MKLRHAATRKWSIAWIGYKKAYDSVPHSWILETVDLDLVWAVDNIKRLLKAAWKRKTVDEIKTPKEYKERMKRKRTEDWSGKQLHGQFKRETKDLSGV